MQTTKSDLSSGKSSQNRSRNSLIDSKSKSNRNNRLLDKALINQHQKQQLLQKYANHHNQLSSSSSSTILLLQQSHLLSHANHSSSINSSSNVNINTINLYLKYKNQFQYPNGVVVPNSNVTSTASNKTTSTSSTTTTTTTTTTTANTTNTITNNNLIPNNSNSNHLTKKTVLLPTSIGISSSSSSSIPNSNPTSTCSSSSSSSASHTSSSSSTSNSASSSTHSASVTSSSSSSTSAVISSSLSNSYHEQEPEHDHYKSNRELYTSTNNLLNLNNRWSNSSKMISNINYEERVNLLNGNDNELSIIVHENIHDDDDDDIKKNLDIKDIMVIIDDYKKDQLNGNSSSDQLINSSETPSTLTTKTRKSTDLNEISLNINDTPKLRPNSKSSSTDDLTNSNSISENVNSFNEELSSASNQTSNKRLVYRKRNSHLNQSLNETDLIINSSNKNKKQHNNKRKLKQRKIDLNEENNNNNNTSRNHNDTFDQLNEYYDEDEEYNSDDAVNNLNKNYLNYRSLQKSKRSIKTIEQTIKNSRSIEKWLNDFDKIKELDQPPIPESPVSTIKPDRTNDELYKLLSDLKQQQQQISNKLIADLPSKLTENIMNLIDLNSNDSTRTIETDMFNTIKKFVLPKSLANADDINYLKWFLNDKNFSLILQQPVLNSLNNNFILQSQNINVKLTDDNYDECIDDELRHSDDDDADDHCYVKYSSNKQTLILLSDKVKNILNKEKELTQETNLNNQGILESFREKYIDTANFNGVKCLMSICKKKLKKNQANSSATSSSSSNSSTPILNTSNTNESNNLHYINYSDLNDKIFLCFLSNFSCKLVENFLASTSNQQQQQQQQQQTLTNSAGFIRKHKIDKSFSYVNLINENDLKNSNFKLCLKLDKWPSGYDFSKRLVKILNSDKLVNYLNTNTCLISLNGHLMSLNDKDNDMETSFEEDDEDMKWCIDTRLAETVIFRSLSKFRLFLYYYIYFIINNLKSILDGTFSSKTNEFKIGNRVLLHHYLRYLDLNHEAISENSINNFEQLNKFFVNFSVYLRTSVLSQYKTLNKPNYFNLSIDIYEYDYLAIKETKLDDFNNLLTKAELYLKKISSTKQFDFSLQYKFLNTSQQTNRLFNEYLIDFFQILFEQFKSKRDHFKINEQVLIEIHEKVIKTNENLNSILAASKNGSQSPNDAIDISAGLLSKFEMYAECVHKYLPQIRQHNQYLLFHYIWTMQVQYLAPFFNYICDMYKSYD